MSQHLSKRLAVLEQGAKAPKTILIRWMTDEFSTLTSGGQRIQREPDEPEEAFIRRGETLLGSGIIFGR